METSLISSTMNLNCDMNKDTTFHTGGDAYHGNSSPPTILEVKQKSNGTRSKVSGLRFPVRFHRFVSEVSGANPEVVRWVGEDGIFINEDHPQLRHYLEEYFSSKFGENCLANGLGLAEALPSLETP